MAGLVGSFIRNWTFLRKTDHSRVRHNIRQTQNPAAHDGIHQVEHRGDKRCSLDSSLWWSLDTHTNTHRWVKEASKDRIKSFNRIVPDSIVNNCPALMMDAMKQHRGWHVKLGNVLRGIWAAASGTAARAQDKGSCPKCLTSLIGDILERTSGNSGVSVTTSVDWPVGRWNRFILGYSTQTNEVTWEKVTHYNVKGQNNCTPT